MIISFLLYLVLLSFHLLLYELFPFLSNYTILTTRIQLFLILFSIYYISNKIAFGWYRLLTSAETVSFINVSFLFHPIHILYYLLYHRCWYLEHTFSHISWCHFIFIKENIWGLYYSNCINSIIFMVYNVYKKQK